MCEPTGQRGAARVELVVGEVVRVGEARVVGVGRERERRAARPAADHLRGEPEPRLRVAAPVGAPRRAVDVAPEPGHVLAQLAEDEVAAVAPEVGAAGALRVARQHRSPGRRRRRAAAGRCRGRTRSGSRARTRRRGRSSRAGRSSRGPRRTAARSRRGSRTARSRRGPTSRAGGAARARRPRARASAPPRAARRPASSRA